MLVFEATGIARITNRRFNMGRKVVGTAILLLFLGIIVLIARDNLSLDDWQASRNHDEVPPGDPETGGSEG